MVTLSAAQIAGVVKYGAANGMPISQTNGIIAVAIALAESGGNTENSKVRLNSNGTQDFGVWQINSIHKPSEDAKIHAGPNWSMAYAISSNGTKWTPWSTYNSGKYSAFMPAATAGWAVATGHDNPDAIERSAGGTSTGHVDDPTTITFQQVDFPKPFDFLNDPLNYMLDPRNRLWLRLGMGIAGTVLILIVVVTLLKNPAVKAFSTFSPVGKALKTAATVPRGEVTPPSPKLPKIPSRPAPKTFRVKKLDWDTA